MAKKFVDNNGLLYFWQKIVNAFVKKENGMGLSQENYTTAEKSKLAGLKNYTITRTKIETSTVIKKNTNYTVPKYTLGENSLNVIFEGCKLIKDVNYKEVNTTTIQFIDWDVPVGSNLEFIVRS